MAHPRVQILTSPTRVALVYSGPRGAQGASGAAGSDGQDGVSFRALGAWVNSSTYAPGNAVTWRSLADPSVNSLWVVKDGASPAVGVEPQNDLTSWEELAGGGTTANSLLINQIAHGFTEIGQPVAFSSATGLYEPADARDADLMAVGLVSNVADADNFTIQFAGRLLNASASAVSGAAAFVAGQSYFLSSVPGRLQTVDPALDGYYSQTLAVALSSAATSSLILLPGSPENASQTVVFGDDPPAAQREGQLWFRTDRYPGLYVSRFDAGATVLMWVQANG